MKKLLLMIAAALLLLQSGNAAETFTLKAAGQPTIAATGTPNGMTFKGFEGKPVLVNFFGKECRYCKREIPELVSIKKRYGNKIGIIGLHVQERMTPQERSRMRFDYPVYEYDDNQAIVRYIGTRARFNGSIPFNIIFNADGDVAEIVPGYIDGKRLEAIFAQLLKR